MNLRKNTLMITATTLLFLIIILFVTSQFIVMTNFVNLENQNMQQNVERALNALSNDISDLDSFAHDWASWDDTYIFIQNNNSEYISSNLVDETFSHSNINIMIYIDSSGKIIAEKAFDLKTKKEILISNTLNEYMLSNKFLLNHSNVNNTSGIIMLPEGPMLIVSRPILTSNEKGPAKGTLIMGRYLNQAEIQHLSQITKLPITISQINNSNANIKINNTNYSLYGSVPIYVNSLSEDIVEGSSILKDINGKPVLMLKIDMPRDIYNQGQESLLYSFASILIVGIVFGIVILLYLDKFVLSRLTKLSVKVSEIGKSDDLSTRIPVKKDDELSSLAKSINNMLSALEKSQHELKISEKGYRLLAEAAQDMIFMLDQNKRFIYANKWTAEQLEHPMESIIGKNVDILFISEISDRLKYSIEKTFREGNSHYVENKMKSGNNEKWFYTSLIPLKGDIGNINAVLGISRDITNLKRTEMELKKYRDHLEKMVEERTKELKDTTKQLENEIIEHKKAEKRIRDLNEDLKKRTVELETINKELESFSYSVSHDLRAPLRSIDGFSQAILEDFNDDLDETGKEYLSRVRMASQRMAQLIDDLLNLSRLTRSEINYEYVDLSKIAINIQKELEFTWPQRNVKFKIEDGIVVRGDAKLLRVMLENLLNNAWKFTSKCKKAKIEFGKVDYNGQKAYYVKDNGAGFNMEYANKLFNPFQRLHNVDEYPGNGIGLATVQRIVHRHGGQIWAEGKVNEGATFYFILGENKDN
ncbi:CHASE4 domain-containing protein [Methanobacterium oryzae]|uniref:CHASE4 domain-containing protein n=1 Tax=Methanobacterium oryzae TaxID=69540 RepID=UPI003D23AD64